MSIKINNKALQKAQINGKEVQKIVINGNTVYTKAAPLEYIGWQLGTTSSSTNQVTSTTVSFKKSNSSNKYSVLFNNSSHALLFGVANNVGVTNITAITSGITINNGLSNWMKKVSGYQNDGTTDYTQQYTFTAASNQQIRLYKGSMLAFNKDFTITSLSHYTSYSQITSNITKSYSNLKSNEYIAMIGLGGTPNNDITSSFTVNKGTALVNLRQSLFALAGVTIGGNQSALYTLLIQPDSNGQVEFVIPALYTYSPCDIYIIKLS